MLKIPARIFLYLHTGNQNPFSSIQASQQTFRKLNSLCFTVDPWKSAQLKFNSVSASGGGWLAPMACTAALTGCRFISAAAVPQAYVTTVVCD